VKRLLWIALSIAALAVAGFAALPLFPQIFEKLIEHQCSLDKPDGTCQRRMVALGHMWSYTENFERAAIWYRRVAIHGDPAAMFHLAWTYEQLGGRNLKATFAYRRAVEQLDMAADLNLDYSKVAGLSEAKDWYRKSADKGFAPAMNNLGELYASGWVDGQNFEKALGLYKAAAQAGSAAGAMNVSLAYRTGRGVARDLSAAKKWAAFVPEHGRTDFDDVALARSTVFGGNVAPKALATMRGAAVKDEAVAVGFQPMKPSASIPTFRSATSQLGEVPDDRLQTLRRRHNQAD
jgi:TPR repeat protein